MRWVSLSLFLFALGMGLGCGSPRAVEAPEAAQAPAAETTEAEAPEAGEAPPAGSVESSITVDPQTKTISGKAAIALLRPIADEAAFTREKQGVDALIKAINANTQIECELYGVVSSSDLPNLRVPLLIVTAEPGLKEISARRALEKYVQAGGVVLLDGSWQGNILSTGTRITPRRTHPLLTEPYNLGEARQRRFRPIEAIEVGKRLGVIITNQDYATFWASTRSVEQTWTVRVGINVLVYALKTSKWSKYEKKAPTKPTSPSGVSPSDIAPI